MSAPTRARIAIVAMSCRLPGASTLDELQDVLDARRTTPAAIPAERWQEHVFAAELPPNTRGPTRAGVLDEIPLDWRRLRLPPVDVERLHRMERAALATMSDALTEAALDDAAMRAKTRIVVGATRLGADVRTDAARRIRRFELQGPVSDALDARMPHLRKDIDEVLERLFNLAAPPIDPDNLAASASLVAGRVANLFDLQGGHVAIDAGMSSGLVAVETGITALTSGQADAVLVCGLSPLLTPSAILAFAHRGLLTEKEHARPFDAAADGAVLGEGAVALVLMREEDVGRRPVYAIIEGIGTADAGIDSTPFTLERAVERAARAAHAAAGEGDMRVAAVETRSCGALEIDRGELAGLQRVYPGALSVSSTAATFGLLPSAAGLVALLKAALAIRRGSFAAHAHDVAVPALRDVDVVAVAQPLGKDARIAVSDAGLGPIVAHCILGAPARRSATTRVLPETADDAIAIVGLGARVPGSDDIPTFWRNVLERVDAIGDLPRNRFDVERMVGTSKDVGAILRTRLAATLSLPKADPDALRLPSKVLDDVDPSVLLALDVAMQAMQDAGFRDGDIDGARGRVVLGQLPYRAREMEIELRVLFADYLQMTTDALSEIDVEAADADAIIRDARGALALGRRPLSPRSLDAQCGVTAPAAVAAALGWSGGALSVDGACASSLASLELAAWWLRQGDADVVLAGGVAYNLLPEYYVALSMLGVLSERTHHPFSLQANGFVPGEGAGCVALMRLADARARGVRVYALLESVGASSDGRGVSIFAPHGPGQVLSVRRALALAHLTPDSIDLVEAHGTGTRLGDETELSTYRAVYGDRDPSQPYSLGTIKSQIGHLSSAAGIAGLIKSALALHNKVIPPSLFDVEGRSVPTEVGANVEMCTVARGWPERHGHARRVAVSSFGLGGVNYHAILGEAPVVATAASRAGSSSMKIALPTLSPPRAPARGPRADRFEVALVHLPLPARPPAFLLARRRVLLCGAGALVGAMQREAEARGASVVVASSSSSGSQREAEVRRLGTPTPIDVVIDLTGIDELPDPFREPAEFTKASTRRLLDSLAVLRAVYDDFSTAAGAARADGAAGADGADRAPGRSGADGADGAPGGSGAGAPVRAYLAVSALGGGLGVLAASPSRLGGAALLGLAKGLKVELPNVLAKGIDLDTADDPRRLARTILDELEDGNERMEVGFVDGQRLAVNLARTPLPSDAEVHKHVRQEDVFLFSGGGRGIVFECALALACMGVRVVVTGRTQTPTGEEPWVCCNDEELATWKRTELAQRRALDATLTPVRFQSDIDALLRQRELHKNLERARRLQADLRYEVCDVTQESAVRELAARVRTEVGPIRGVIHGAMVEWSTSLPKKSEGVVARTVESKVLGMLNLLAATDEDKPHTFIAFGSGAGRFGSRGQSDYCAANNQLASLMATAARDRWQRTRFATLDWTAWAETGAAARDPDMAALVRATGVTSIRTGEGVYWFLTELLRGRAQEVVVFEERMLSALLALGDTAEGRGERAVCVDATGAPLVPGRWPMVDVVGEHRHDRIAFDRTLDVERDSFLTQHTLEGVPILPGTFGCELLAEAAALVSPGWQVESLLDVDIGAPAKLFRNEPLVLQVRGAVVDETAERRVIDCESRSDLLRAGQVLQRGRLHHRGRFIMRRAGERPARNLVLPELGGVVRTRSFFHMTKDPVGLGPLFCRAARIQIAGNDVVGEIAPPRLRDVMSTTSYPRFLLDPLTMDNAFQIAANWDGCVCGFVSVPVGIDGLTVGRERSRGEAARAWARVTRIDDPVVVYDIDVVGEDNEVILEVRGLRLHRVARVTSDDS